MKESGPFLIILATLTFLSVSPGSVLAEFEADMPKIELTSAAFTHGNPIPVKHSCDGKNQSPPLRWSEGPPETKSFAILADDPDAPAGTWTHWILYNLPARVFMIPGGMPPIKALANSERHGTNDFKKLGYGGPCPPSGTHRYFFKIYALNTSLDLDAGIDRNQFLDGIEGHILAEGELMGTYTREKGDA